MAKEVLWAYLRVSSEVQLEGLSMDTQEEHARAKAKELGFDIEILEDGGKSASDDNLDKRPSMAKLLEGVKAGFIKHVYVI